jgi:hypothetical protein
MSHKTILSREDGEGSGTQVGGVSNTGSVGSRCFRLASLTVSMYGREQ